MTRMISESGDPWVMSSAVLTDGHTDSWPGTPRGKGSHANLSVYVVTCCQ